MSTKKTWIYSQTQEDGYVSLYEETMEKPIETTPLRFPLYFYAEFPNGSEIKIRLPKDFAIQLIDLLEEGLRG